MTCISLQMNKCSRVSNNILTKIRAQADLSLILLHSEKPTLYGVLAVLGAKGLYNYTH